MKNNSSAVAVASPRFLKLTAHGSLYCLVLKSTAHDSTMLTVLVARMEKDFIRVKQFGILLFTTHVLILFCHASRHNSGLGWTKAREYSFQV